MLAMSRVLLLVLRLLLLHPHHHPQAEAPTCKQGTAAVVMRVTHHAGCIMTWNHARLCATGLQAYATSAGVVACRGRGIQVRSHPLVETEQLYLLHAQRVYRQHCLESQQLQPCQLGKPQPEAAPIVAHLSFCRRFCICWLDSDSSCLLGLPAAICRTPRASGPGLVVGRRIQRPS